MKRLLLLLLLAFVFVGCSNLEKIYQLEAKGDIQGAYSESLTHLSGGSAGDRAEAAGLTAKFALQLGKVEQEEAGRLILPLLANEANVQKAALRALVKLKYLPAKQSLVELAPKVKGAVLRELAVAIGALKATSLLIDHYEETEDAKLEAVIIAVGAEAATELANRIKGSGQTSLIALLASFETKEAALALVSKLSLSSSKKAITIALITMRQPAVDAISTMVNSNKGSPLEKAAMALVLGEIKLRDSVPSLETLARDSSPLVRAAAELALAKVRGF